MSLSTSMREAWHNPYASASQSGRYVNERVLIAMDRPEVLGQVEGTSGPSGSAPSLSMESIMKPSTPGGVGRILLAALPFVFATPPLSGQQDLNDLEMAHVAVTASAIDIGYAHLALAFSESPEVRSFAETMIRDHTAVNGQIAALAERLGVTAQDNAMSRDLLAQARETKDRMSRLRGAEFDRFYARNELEYHRTVNGVVADAFIPNIQNADVRRAFESALAIFRGHEGHAAQMVRTTGTR